MSTEYQQVNGPPAKRRKFEKRSPDRPRLKLELSGTDWVLVFLRSGRQFVHNSKTGESLWTPPEDVQDIIDRVDTDELILLVARARGLKLKSDKKKKKQEQAPQEQPVQSQPENKENSQEESVIGSDQPKVQDRQIVIEEAHESEEGSDIEYENSDSDAQPDDADDASSPGEDLAWLDEEIPDADIEGEDIDPRVTFMQLLDDNYPPLNPYSEWDLEYPKIIDDDRYGVYDTMRERKEAFDAWATQKIAWLKAEQQKAQADTSASSIEDKASKDETVKFLRFIAKNYKPKYYFVDFKRKFRKLDEFEKSKLKNDEKEALFRTFSINFKKPETERIKNFQALLESHDSNDIALLRDPKYYVVSEEIRNSIINS